MIESILVFIPAVTVLGGYLLIFPRALMACWEWLRIRVYRLASSSHFGDSVVDLCGSPGIAGRLFIRLFQRTGRPMVVVGLVPSPLLAEDKYRRYLLMGAAGLCFFYGISIGELP